MRALDAALPLPSQLCKQRTVGVVPQLSALRGKWKLWEFFVDGICLADWHCLLTGLTAILQLGNAPNAG